MSEWWTHGWMEWVLPFAMKAPGKAEDEGVGSG